MSHPHLRSVAVLSAAMLASCGPPETDRAPLDNAALAADPTYQRIAALPAAQQRGVFLRAILDSDQKCQGVTEASTIAPQGGRPAWAAVCKEGTRWMLVLQPDGVMKVTGPVPPVER